MLASLVRFLRQALQRWGDASLRKSLDNAELAIEDRDFELVQVRASFSRLEKELERVTYLEQQVAAMTSTIGELRKDVEAKDVELRKIQAVNTILELERKTLIEVVTRDRERVAMETAIIARQSQEATHATGETLRARAG